MTTLLLLTIRFTLILLAVRFIWSLLNGPEKQGGPKPGGGPKKESRFDTKNETVADAEYKDL
ncbi:MAG: hypothetical protein GF363_02095 [Chitinivibrionales bacterium]|nr:hypothetical protein [Chitinivibrionales bacterium]